METEGLSPVVLVPGVCGSVFRAKLAGATRPHWWCDANADWFVTWLNIKELAPGQKDCTLARLMSTFDAASGNYSDAAGVTLDSSVDFGGVGGIAELDPGISATKYFKPMIEHLVGKGYVVGGNLHGAPYDWRMAPDGHAGAYQAYGGSYYLRLRALIESTFSSNNNTKVHILSHSLGGPTILAFLNRQTAAWKDQYIRSFIPISGPWGGAVELLEADISGHNFGIPVIPDDYLKPIQSTAASGSFLLPDAAAFGDAVLVATPSRNYTASDIPHMLQVLNLTQAGAILSRLEDEGLKTHQLQPAGVDTHLIWSYGVKTQLQLRYNSDLHAGFDKPATAQGTGDGDGTVNIESSLFGYALFGNNEAKAITYRNFSGPTHNGIIGEAAVMAYVDVLLGI